MNEEVIYPSMVIRSQAEAIELLEKENKKYKEVIEKLENKIKELIKYELGTDISLREFKEFYKLATGKDYDPKKCPEVE